MHFAILIAGLDMTEYLTNIAGELNSKFARLTVLERLEAVAKSFPKGCVFTTSFGLEDQVLTHFIAQNRLAIKIVTLDTGRLFPQTYSLWQETEEKYGIRIKAKYPQSEGLEALIDDQSINGFYFSPDMRKQCCFTRKIEPLGRALMGQQLWITGLRGDQSAARHDLAFVSFDGGYNLIKANPLYDMSRNDLVLIAQQNDIPINSLHKEGFLSIGCAPCTRAIRAGEEERAGRWWWETETARECGLHVQNSHSLSAKTTNQAQAAFEKV